MNKDGDYSAAYVLLSTDDSELGGFGLTFTIGRGNELCVAAARRQAALLVGMDVDVMAADMGAVYRALTDDSQLRWLGPEKGVVHLSLAAVLNAAWDLVARRAGVPLWRLLAGMSAQQLAAVADLRYVSDVLTRAEAESMLAALEPTRAERIALLDREGYPCYTTSPGWLGYTDEKLERLCKEAVAAGFSYIKLKVGANLADDRRRCAIARDILGPDRHLMIDANQMWDVAEAIEWVNALADFKPLWVEEPTSPDDILGHAAIRAAVRADRGRYRRTRSQQGDVQTVPASRGDRLRTDRLLQAGQCQRDHHGALDGRQVRRPGLPARGRCGALRACSAPVDLRLHRSFRAAWTGASRSTSTTSTNTSRTRAS